MQLHLGLSAVRSAPIYVPAFVFRSTHLGNKLRTFVSGPSLLKPRSADLSHASLCGLTWVPLSIIGDVCSLHTEAARCAQE